MHILKCYITFGLGENGSILIIHTYTYLFINIYKYIHPLSTVYMYTMYLYGLKVCAFRNTVVFEVTLLNTE